MSTRRMPAEHGAALLLSLLVLTLLIIIILQMTYTSAQGKSIAQNYLLDLQNSAAARSGVTLARLYLQADSETAAAVDSLHEAWAKPLQKQLGSSELTVTIEDTERRINLAPLIRSDGKVNPVVEKQLKTLAQNLGHSEEAAAMIIDYMDSDTTGDYEDMARNGVPINLEEFLRIKNFKREYLYGITTEEISKKGMAPFLTLWPQAAPASPPPPGGGGQPPPASAGRHRINVNTAPVEVLMALSPSVTADMANAIVSARSTQGQDGKMKEFKQIDEIKAVSSMGDDVFNQIKDDLTVKSTTFIINATARAGKLEKGWTTYVVRGQGGKFTTLYSQRQHTLFAIAPPPEKDSNQ